MNKLLAVLSLASFYATLMLYVLGRHTAMPASALLTCWLAAALAWRHLRNDLPD